MRPEGPLHSLKHANVTRLCAVTSITKYEPGFRDQVHRLATYVVGNVRKGLNCEKEVQKNKTLRHESLLTRVVSSSQETR